VAWARQAGMMTLTSGRIVTPSPHDGDG
jgi:hypothetical protein